MTRTLVLAALCSLATPALADNLRALPPGPCRGTQSVLCHKLKPTRADLSFTLTECTDKKLGTQATAWRPGLTDKSVPEHSWKVAEDHRNAPGAGHTFHAPGFKLTVNWTTSPRDGGHVGHVNAKVGGQQIDEQVICNLQGGHAQPRHPAAPKADEK